MSFAPSVISPAFEVPREEKSRDGFPAPLAATLHSTLPINAQVMPYLVGVAAVAVAAAAREALAPLVGHGWPLVTFVFPTIAVALLCGRPAPALFTAALGLVVGPYLFMPMAGDWLSPSAADRARVVVYVTTSLAVIALLQLSRARFARIVSRAENASRMLSAIVNTTPQAIIATDADGRVTAWNPAATRMFGWRPEEVVGRPIPTIPEDQRRLFQMLLSRAMAGESLANRPVTRRRRDGSLLDCESSVTPLRENGVIIGVLATIVDVSQRHQAERDVLLAQEGLRRDELLLDHVRDSVIVTDLDGIVTYWNEGATRLFGWARGERIGRPLVDGYPDEVRPKVTSIMKRLTAGHGWSGEFEDYCKDGSRIWIEVRVAPIHDCDGRPIGFIGISHDVIARRLGEEALRASEERFRQIAESIREVFWLSTPDAAETTYVSPAYETVWGRPRSSFGASPRAWLDAIHPDDRERVALAARTKQAAGSYDEEYRIIRPDGAVRWIRDRAFPVATAAGPSGRIAGVAEDITERRELETQLRQAQKMEAVGYLAGGVAHDFNNLLTIINGYSEMLLATHGMPEETREQVAEIRKAGERSAGLTAQLLALSRQQVLAPKVLALNDVVRDAEKMLRRLIGEDVALTAVLHPGLWRVKADPSQLQQVLLNLAVNARDAMPCGGHLHIETRNVDIGTAAATRAGLTPGRYVMLSMSDSGSGMSEEVTRHVFEPFFTTKGVGKGTGLGLAVVHGIVKQSGGHITVHSEPGAGTRFDVHLPRIDQPATEGEAPVTTARLPGGNECILLVEDEEAVRGFSRIVLEKCGYRVLEARHGIEALRLAAEATDVIALLITDVVMPEMGGRALADQLQERFPAMKVMYISGYTSDAVVRYGVLQDQVNFLQKPFSPRALAEKVREVLTAGA